MTRCNSPWQSLFVDWGTDWLTMPFGGSGCQTSLPMGKYVSIQLPGQNNVCLNGLSSFTQVKYAIECLRRTTAAMGGFGGHLMEDATWACFINTKGGQI